VRTYILFMGPADQDMEWTDTGIEGVVRFLRRLWRVVLEVATHTRPMHHNDTQQVTALGRKAHTTIAKATNDIERRFHFHTPIAAVMELTNELSRSPDDPAARFAAETAVSLIQPYAPHMAAELWERLGRERLWDEPWPEADPALLERETFELVVQVNGRVRDRMEVPSDLADDELVERATASPRVQSYLDGGKIRQTIVVPKKLVNFVTD
jgi:leucyl-tRNA synthetase